MKKILSFVCALLLASTLAAQNSVPQPKREFRGAWIQCVNGQFEGLGRDAMQANLTRQLDCMKQCGVNVIIFQVRPEADALYESSLEPWSRFLTGTQGVAPNPYWDPLDWMIKESHKRGMELHAWINPYRAKTKGTTQLAKTHPYYKHPERFFKYGDLLLFDPGQAANREYICKVVRDIVSRYDVDGLHIDDYFYPYPVAGEVIPDDDTFRRNANGFTDRGDWRRYNVNLLVQDLYETVHSTKPWVKFGVSPFGIYHNERNGGNIPGSATNGLQNYDDLYADVLYWEDKGWVDYVVPQLYWEIGHKVADFDTLARWWNKYCGKRTLVFGQDVERTVKYVDVNNPRINQLPAKWTLQRTLPNVKGSCLWYSAAVVANTGNFATALKKRYHKYPALQPEMKYISSKSPGKVRKLKVVEMDGRPVLFWTAPKTKNDWASEATKYVVYRFAPGERVDLESAANIVKITGNTFCKLPYVDGKTRYTYVVTALNRIQNESAGKKKKISL